MTRDRAHSSRQRYRIFVDDYKHRRLDDVAEAAERKALDAPAGQGGSSPPGLRLPM